MSSGSDKPVERVLVLSGGGGRGAYQVGVCQVLEDIGWWPDMVLGNSIGATNGAMFIAPKGASSGARLLDRVWREEMLSDRIQAVSGEWSWPLHEIMRLALDALLRSQAPSDCRPAHAALRSGLTQAVTARRPPAEFEERPLPTGEAVEHIEEWVRELKRWFERQFERFLGQFDASAERLLGERALMDRAGWRDVLARHVDFDRLNGPDAPCFGVVVTDVATGAPCMFWNRVPEGVQGARTGVTVDHVMASSSIPGFYEATSVGGRYYWDGVLATNTPIAPAIEAGATDVVVVLLTPWAEPVEAANVPTASGAPTILHALERFMDWMMLAPFRGELGRLGEDERKRITIIAPREFQGIVSVLDYDEEDNATLIECGVRDAAEVLQARPVPG
jgi:NTE family protein